ncbi:MAG: plasmid replication protein RepC [Methylocystis sp.]|uniref:plasmid replication protein RepC n=1 Tax=Methylocystis sp. TaxID=1911079 RepID=UPI003DA1D648
MTTQTTTPFGRRPLSLAVVASQAAARAFAQTSGGAGGASPVVHKWRLFRSLTEAKARLGVGDRALSVLYALLSFHPETALSPPAPEDETRAALTVFPSNRELSLRAHGMAAATLRRHLASLVEAGLILRRDSANGKRFARRAEGGDISEAFGFDLTPLVMRAEEIGRMAEEGRAEARARGLLREKITLLRREAAKMIETGLAEGVPGDWAALNLRLAHLCAEPLRLLSTAQLSERAKALDALAAEARKWLESFVLHENMSASESRNERHIQNQTTNHSDLEPRLREGRAEPSGVTGDAVDAERAGEAEDGPLERKSRGGPSARPYPLGMVLQACPDIADYAKSGEISCWRDLIDAAAIVRSALGVSPDAWRQALEAMGEDDASIVIAAILQRGEEITSAGGYLRALTAKARTGEFSLGPVLMALLRGKSAKAARERKRAG